MSLKNRIVEIAYSLRDQFSSKVGKITAGFKKVESSSDKSSRKVENNNNRAARSFGRLAAAINPVKIAILAVGTAIVGTVISISKWTTAANIQQRAETKLATTLTNLVGASEAQIQSLKDQAAALQKVTGFGDEQTISAQAMLGTFRLTAEQIQVLTPRLLDMAESSRKAGSSQVDLETISIALGKALTNGIGSLSRYGVAMTDVQKEAFKLADQNGQVAILAEVLDGNFKGLAEAVGSTYEGAVRKADAAQGDFLEVLGKLFTENKAFINLQQLIAQAWEKMGKGISGSAKEIGIAITAVANIINGAGRAIRVGFNAIQIAVKIAVTPTLVVLELLFRAVSKITGGDLSAGFEKTANDIRKYTGELATGIGEDFTDIGESLGLVDEKLEKFPDTAKNVGKAANVINIATKKMDDSFDSTSNKIDQFNKKAEESRKSAQRLSAAISKSLDDIAVSADKPIGDLGATDVTRGIDQVNNALDKGNYESAQRRIEGVLKNINKLKEDGFADKGTGEQFLKSQLERLDQLQEKVAEFKSQALDSEKQRIEYDIAFDFEFNKEEVIESAKSAASAAQNYMDSNPVKIRFDGGAQLSDELSREALKRGRRR